MKTLTVSEFFLILVIVLIFIYCLFQFFRIGRLYLLYRRANNLNIKEATNGFVELSGQADYLEGVPTKSYAADKTCCWYDFRMYKGYLFNPFKRALYWRDKRTLLFHFNHQQFIKLTEGTESCYVISEQAYFKYDNFTAARLFADENLNKTKLNQIYQEDGKQQLASFCNVKSSRPLLAFKNAYESIEYYICKGDVVYVSGYFETISCNQNPFILYRHQIINRIVAYQHHFIEKSIVTFLRENKDNSAKELLHFLHQQLNNNYKIVISQYNEITVYNYANKYDHSVYSPNPDVKIMIKLANILSQEIAWSRFVTNSNKSHFKIIRQYENQPIFISSPKRFSFKQFAFKHIIPPFIFLLILILITLIWV